MWFLRLILKIYTVFTHVAIKTTISGRTHTPVVTTAPTGSRRSVHVHTSTRHNLTPEFNLLASSILEKRRRTYGPKKRPISTAHRSEVGEKKRK